MEANSPHLSLTRTKLHRPPVATVHVHRQLLLDRLNKQLDRPLTLVSAPAGYGKSTLVSCWLEDCDHPSAWLSIDETDNDLHLFLAYFLAAARTIFPNIGEQTQAFLTAQELPPLPVLAGCLINELDQIDQDFILTIDDYHVVQNKLIHELLEEIMKHPPHAMHLVLVSRIDPPLPLATIRARGQVTEIRVRDLRFSRKETAEFLQQMLETTINESIAATLEEKTEGWVTGLHLAALSLRHKEDFDSVITGLPDDSRFVMDYLVAEILSQQPLAMQERLLKTSILGHFCASLCDAVCLSDVDVDVDAGCGEISGQNFISLLKGANLFTIELDDENRWFRYHHLFRNLLLNRLKDLYKTKDIDVLHINASAWFAENGHFEEAIQHALAGGDVDRAVEFVGIARHELMNRDQWHRLERWLKLFSYEAVEQYPHLLLLRCWLDLYHWYRLDALFKDLARADTLLEKSTLNTGETSPLRAEMAAIRSNLAYWLLQPEQGMALAKQALRESPLGHECTQSTALLGLGALHQMLGDIRQGEHLLWDHMEEGRFSSPSSRARLLQSMCLSYWPEADTHKLQQAASGLLQISLEHDLSWNHSFARYFLGLIHYERNELSDAVAQLEIIVGDSYLFPIQSVTHCSFLLSLCYQALGLPDQAHAVAESIAKHVFERSNEMFVDLVEAFQADLNLHQGRITQADEWARGFVAPAPHGMQRYFNAELVYIRVMIARSTPESLNAAVEQIDSMVELLVQINHRRLLIDVLGMKALVADALGQESTAIEKLSEALMLAEPGGFIRPFLDLGQQMADLLKRLVMQKPDLKYAALILAAFTNVGAGVGQDQSNDQTVQRSDLSNSALPEPLTNREIEILLILAKGLSNHEIAAKLFISPETVKRHLSNIYQKFEVKNRQQAIVKAKSLGLL